MKHLCGTLYRKTLIQMIASLCQCSVTVTVPQVIAPWKACICHVHTPHLVLHWRNVTKEKWVISMKQHVSSLQMFEDVILLRSNTLAVFGRALKLMMTIFFGLF